MAEAIMMGMFAFSAIGGTVSGGISAAKEQAQISEQVCNIGKQMNQYKGLIQSEVNLLAAANAEVQSQVNNLGSQITLIKNAMRDQKADFQSTYNRWVVIGMVFLIMLVFLFASKKFILGAHTE